MAESSLLDQLNKSVENKLNKDFTIELFKCCFSSIKIFEICKQHLKFHYLENEAQKKVLKFLYDSHDVNGKIPTVGIVGQSFVQDREVMALLAQIKKIEIHNDSHEIILSEFETFIKKSRFIALNNKIRELFNQGKHDEAIEVQAAESASIVEFQLRENYYTAVFKDFEKRNSERKSTVDKVLNEKCCIGIDECDDITRGGIAKGTSALVTARSGVGKSTFLRWVALCNARQGKKVLFFSAEGTEKELLAAFDAGWSSITLDKMELGEIPFDKQAKIKKAHRDILATNGEIFCYCAEQFESMSIEDCREVIIDLIKIHGNIDLVCWDYLELFNARGIYGNSESAERKRREDIGQKITNLAVEFNHAGLAATQASDVAPEVLKKPDFVLTRHNTAECKGLVRPFSYHFTLNATPDEYNEEIMRIYFDKLRKGKSGQTVRIYQSRANSRMYDSARTRQTFYTHKN